MRCILLVAVFVQSLFPAAPKKALSDRLATGFLAQPAKERYWAMASSYRASFDSEGIHLVRHGRRAAMRFPGAHLQWEAEGERLGQVTFLGAENGSYTGAAALRARQAFPGVDIVIRLRDGRLKSEFQLAPGVLPSVAGYCLDGAAVESQNHGQTLQVDAGAGWQWQEAGLESWQTTSDGRRLPVETRFQVQDQCVRFQMEGIDAALPLTIDPELAFSTYLGGGLFDAVTAIATDTQGNLYLGGWTESSDFPSISGFQGASGGRIDGFVAKVNAAGQLLFATYLGGAGEDRVQAIVVDGAGVITVAGHTNSTNFPTLAAARSALSGGRDAFVARLNSTGNQLVFSTYWGGLAHDAALAVALDPGGNAIIAGETASTDFPTQAAYSATSGGGVDGFLARFSTTGALQSSTYFGGGADDRIRGVAVAANGTLHLTGSTGSSNFPVPNGPYPALRGSMDGFYARLNGAATALSLSTYLGGAGGSSLSEEAGYGIAVDTLGRAWIAGVTPSADFPGVSAGHQIAYGGGSSDAFVSVFTTSGALEWSTYIGGTGIDAATSIAAGAGFVGLSGYTASADLPVSSPLQATRAGGYDAFWAAYPVAATAPLYISYLGGAGSDSALATAASGSAMAIGGSTLSANFPLQLAPQASNPGSYGGFASRLRFGPGPITVSPAAGTGTSGSFTFNIAHANGNASIVNAAFLFNTTNSFSNGCYVYFDRANNLVSLYKDAGAVWLPLTPGAAATVDNGLCSISGAALTVTTTASSLIITLPVAFTSAFIGPRNIYANATDDAALAAGWPQVGTWTIAVPAAPTIGTVTPSSGAGVSQVFAFTFSDANGAADIVTASAFFNDVYSTGNGCYFTYNRAANSLSLYRDADAAFLPVTPGANTTVENTNCSLSGAGAAVASAGNTLTLTVPITFKSSVIGPRSVYASATDYGGLSTNWQQVGAWTPTTNTPPAISSLFPASGTGASQTFTVSFADSNGASDIASAGFLINSAVSATGGCYLVFSATANTLSLFRDSDSAWIPITPGSNTTVENNACSVAGAGFVVSATGSQLALTIPIVFKPGFVGPRSLYATATDRAGLTSGWQSIGSWTPYSALSPSISSLSPSAGSGISRTFTLTLADGNGHADIVSAGFVINTSATNIAGCYISYTRSSNTFTLYSDSDASQQAITPGTAGNIENAKCALSGTGLVVAGSGSDLVISLPISFKPAFSGTKSIFVNGSDAAGLSPGWTLSGTWNPGSPATPMANAVSPNAGSGASQTFAISLSDTNGFEDIAGASILFNSAVDGNNACFLFYSRAANLVYLFRDADGTWQGLAPGSAASVSNANCTLSGGAMAISRAGTTISLTLPLVFNSSFSGTRNIYVSVNDESNLTSGWVTLGTWNPAPTNTPPTLTSLSPSTGAGASQTFTFQLADTNGSNDIASVVFILNTAINGNNACYFSYGRASNTFYFFQDATGSWLPLTPGSASSVSNQNCTLSGTGLTVSASGATLTISLPLTFTAAFSGLRNFYVAATDTAGLSSSWILAGTWNPAPTAHPPTVASLAPNTGAGTPQTFTLTLSDNNGNGDIAGANIIINNSINGTNSCFLSFSRSAGTIYLFRDSDSKWLPLAPGQSSSVANSNCSLSGSGFAVTPSGNTLTLSLPLTFNPSFVGNKNFYVAVSDLGQLSSGWIVAGTWNPVANLSPPAVTSLSPNTGSGTSQTFSLTLSDTNGHGDIAGANIIINGSINGTNACFLSFSRSANAIYLFRDSDSSWQALAPGQPGSVSNSNCTLAGTNFTVTASGDSLTLALPLTFSPAFSGPKNFYVAVSDLGQLSSRWVTAGSWIPGGAAAPPTVAPLTPNSGSGANRTFNFQISDNNGNADVAGAVVIINGGINGNNACFFSYSRATNTLSLFRDADNSWPTIASGAATSVNGTNCTISGAGLTASGAGNTLSLSVPISFNSAFAGPKNVYVLATDSTGLNSGWVTAGSWTVN